MYRSYRVGELPDIQIKYSEIIRPLQALAQVLNNLYKYIQSRQYTGLSLDIIITRTVLFYFRMIVV